MVKHLAVIMDGNGRWAKKHLKVRTFGHQAGVDRVQDITEFCAKKGISYLSLYAFSTENWKRPKAEIDFLMKLLENYLDSKVPMYLESNIIFKSIGDLSIFKKNIQEKILALEELTQTKCDGLTQILALNYGSRDELKRAALKSQSEHLALEDALDTAGIPDVDMLIRTGGEQRLSNFLLWQSAYAELFFTQTLWPDFNAKELEEMLCAFENRNRRFGGL